MVFVADTQETLNWVLALKLIARTPGNSLPDELRTRLRAALSEERWGDAVETWIAHHSEIDIYPSFEFHLTRDVELGAQELQFTPLFAD
jgi:plasmid stability protein